MRVGILGGSFNPVHRGHVRLAEVALSELNLDRIYLVPAKENPLKRGGEILPAPLRLSLLKKAVKGIDGLEVSDCELKRKGASFTVDTLRYFKKRSGKNAQLYFVSGLDSLEGLGKWKSVEQVFKLCRFVAAARPGSIWKETKFPVIRMPFDAIDVSSTEVRRRLKAKKSVKELVPTGTEAELKKYYRTAKKGAGTSKRRKSWN